MSITWFTQFSRESAKEEEKEKKKEENVRNYLYGGNKKINHS